MMKNIWTRNRIRRNCPLCDHDTTQQVSKQMQFHLDLETVICNVCSFVYTNPLPEAAIYDRFYNEAYASYYGHIALPPSGGLKTNIPDGTRHRLTQIASIVPLKGKRLVEIGPGYGTFLWWAREQGCDVIGIEPSDTFYEAVSKEGLPCIHGFLDTVVPAQSGGYDVVVMFHVLEHFYEPNRALQKCRDLLGEDGILVVEVPNILKPFRSLDRYFLRYVHPSSFSPQSLRALFEKHGFDLELVDEAGHEWRTPQSLFVIAKKRPSNTGHFEKPTQSAEEVLTVLKNYRKQWRTRRMPQWYMYYYSRVIRRWGRRIQKFIRTHRYS
jgi:SAM-dependent methyltransferase